MHIPPAFIADPRLVVATAMHITPVSITVTVFTIRVIIRLVIATVVTVMHIIRFIPDVITIRAIQTIQWGAAADIVRHTGQVTVTVTASINYVFGD